MKFTRWQHYYHENEKEFYEIRSVGHSKAPTFSHLKNVSSDFHIDYKNVARIPIEIENLTDDKMKLKNVPEGGDFYVQLYSQPSMLQRLKSLMDNNENFKRHHFTLFDVMLLKFQPTREKQEIFDTKSYRKVLPTPLCFRDFNDYGKNCHPPDSLANFHYDDGDKRFPSQCKPDFLLETSIKRKLLQENEKESAESEKDVKEKEDEPTNVR